MSSPTLDAIADRGNRRKDGKRDNLIQCADGFTLSVIAGPGLYCTPRPSLGPHFPGDDVPESYPGPYSHVEVGFPSARPEPWHCTAWNEGYDRHKDHPVCDGWQVRADSASDDSEDEWNTIYSYVPVDVVRSLIESHGGESVADSVKA